MRIACLQFAPQVGDIDNNLNRADAVLSKANPQKLDLLVLPELAFTGYNFKSLQHISPYLEPTTSGITSLWARTTALKYECVVTVGYPEKVDVSPKWPASPEYYNSAITVNADGETIANYRKSFLYYTDETWALEGPDGFFDGEIEGLGNVAMGICKWPTKSFERMDLNPYKFEAPWSAWEFAYHILHKEANLVILSMAWLTREDARSYSRCPKDPDMDTLSYWLARMEPLIRAETEGEIICVFANRSGTEGEAVYAGTSAVLGIHAGEVKVYGILGRGEKELLVVDTNKRPQAKLISEPNSTASGHRDISKDIPNDIICGAKDARKSTSDASAVSRADASIDARTNSTVSNRSDLSLNTNVTACTVPDFSDACFPKSMEDVVTPLSALDANSPSAFFSSRSRRLEGETLIDNLRSSIGQNGQQPHETGLPDSPTTHRPSSPKSRNASRNRQREYQEPIDPARTETPTHQFRPASPKSRNASRTRMVEYPEPTGPARTETPVHVRPASPKSRNASRTRMLEYQEPALLYHDLAKVEQRTTSPVFVRPASRNFSRNQHVEHQEPALVSHDLEKEEQIKNRAIGMTSPIQPQSAASAPDQRESSFSPRLTGMRRSLSLGRPRSAIW